MVIDSKAIRNILIDRQLGVTELAKTSNVNISVISHITRFDKNVNFKTVGKLSQALNLDYREFIKEV